MILLAPGLAAGQARCSKVTFTITMGAAEAFFTGSATADIILGV